jgi:hypothetical protein
MIRKDRYSIAFIIFFISILVIIIFMKSGYFKSAAIATIAGIIPFIVSLLSSAKIHLTDDQKNKLDIEYKGENDCVFTQNFLKKIDGIKLNGKRYKFPNGTDIYINDKNEVKPCGFGSKLVLSSKKFGIEPSVIQNDPCWQ